MRVGTLAWGAGWHFPRPKHGSTCLVVEAQKARKQLGETRAAFFSLFSGQCAVGAVVVLRLSGVRALFGGGTGAAGC